MNPKMAAGAGTSDNSFIWGIVGDNQAFGDMDLINVDQLK
jgi:5-keto 4-deoxyuronate isomerase